MKWDCLDRSAIQNLPVNIAKSLLLNAYSRRDSLRYDLVIEDADGRFWRVQCKTAWISKDQACLVFNSASNHYHYKGGRTTNARRDYRGQVEYFAVYSPDTDKVYLVPVDHVATAHGFLRLLPTENNQKKGVRWAKDYEL